jgi:hypothetical protein
VDTGNRVRIGGTDTLNTAAGITQTFGYHPSRSPFSITNVLTTYTRIEATAGCTINVQYDTKFAPVNGHYTGAITIAAENDCGPGSCFDLIFDDSSFNAAGSQRICYDPLCELG